MLHKIQFKKNHRVVGLNLYFDQTTDGTVYLSWDSCVRVVFLIYSVSKNYQTVRTVTIHLIRISPVESFGFLFIW